jgi:hypothetical protein
MSDLYVLWDVIGRSTLKFCTRQTNRYLQTIPLRGKSIALMHPRSLGFVAVSHLKVKPSTSDERSLIPLSVWGVIWLIIAFMYFAAGILVGLVAFKVLTSSPSAGLR